jgi:hypothetical protein
MLVSPDDEGYIARGVGSAQTEGAGRCWGTTARPAEGIAVQFLRGVAYPNLARPQLLDDRCRTVFELLFGTTMRVDSTFLRTVSV